MNERKIFLPRTEDEILSAIRKRNGTNYYIKIWHKCPEYYECYHVPDEWFKYLRKHFIGVNLPHSDGPGGNLMFEGDSTLYFFPSPFFETIAKSTWYFSGMTNTRFKWVFYWNLSYIKTSISNCFHKFLKS